MDYKAGVPGCLIAFALLSAVGCGSSDSLAPVAGTVTIGGKAVRRGTVRFIPTRGGRPATGQLRADGTYSMSTKKPGDGVAPGDYQVTIVAKEEVAGGDDISVPAGVRPPKLLVPEKYGSTKTSGLTATVEAGRNTADFELEWD